VRDKLAIHFEDMGQQQLKNISSHFVPASATARRFFIPTVSEDRVDDLEYFNEIEARNLGKAGMKPFFTISNTKWTCAISTFEKYPKQPLSPNKQHTLVKG
jgi:hypothetical protein